VPLPDRILGSLIGDAVGSVPERRSLSLSDGTQLTLATCRGGFRAVVPVWINHRGGVVNAEGPAGPLGGVFQAASGARNRIEPGTPPARRAEGKARGSDHYQAERVNARAPSHGERG
jgi:hypothetical protein